MALAFDAATTGNNTSGTSLTWAHTVTGSNTITFIGILEYDDTITSVTVNAVAASRVATHVSIGNGIDAFMLAGSTTGNIVVTVSTNTFAVLSGGASSYTGANQTGQPDSSATNTALATNQITGTTTVVAANSWLWCIALSSSGAATITGGAGTTFRAEVGNFGARTVAIFDSNGAVSAGSQSLVVDSDQPLQSLGIIVASFKPVAASGPANLKSLNTNLKANIKSINTNLIANVKSYNTNV